MTLRLIFLLSILFLYCFTASAQCNIDAGTFDPETLLLTNGDFLDASAIHSGSVLETGDVSAFYLSMDENFDPGNTNILVSSPTGEFDLSLPIIEFSLSVYVHVVVADDVGNGLPDLTDNCIAISDQPLAITLENNCAASIGSFSITSLNLNCNDSYTLNASEYQSGPLDPNDRETFWLFDTPVSDVLLSDPVLQFDSLYIQRPDNIDVGQPYYLYAVAGDVNGSGATTALDACANYTGEPLVITWGSGEPLKITFDDENPVVSCTSDPTIVLASISGGQPPYTYSWSNGETGSSITVLDNREYTVTITDANQCTTVGSVIATEPSHQLLTVDSTFNISCQNPVGTIYGSYDPNFDLAYFFAGQGSVTYPTDSTFIYTTTFPEPNGIIEWAYGSSPNSICADSITPYSILETSTGCAFISGNVFRDNDGDCQQNSNEVGLAQRLVKMTGSVERYANSDANGYYTLFAPPNESVTLEIVSDHLLYENCNPPLTLSTPAAGQTLTQNLGQQTLADCPLLDVQVTTGPVRRCFDVGIYIDYCNDGTLAAEDTYILLELDPLYQVNLDSLINITLEADGRYRIEIGNLAEGECGSFYLPALLSCDAELGQVLCLEATILPEYNCLPTDPNYSGAVVEVEGRCDNGTNRFVIRNTGTAAMPMAQDFIVIEDGVVLMQSPFNLPAGDSIGLAYPGTGQTYRVEADQVPNFPVNSMPSATVEGCTTDSDGQFTTGIFLQFNLDDQYPGFDLECNEVIGSFDPNDKTPYPRGYEAARYIENDTPLEYHIRFQNTGTDTAFTVVVEDALDPSLDVSTFRPLGSSHAYEVEFGTADTVRFVFNDILLPDSFVNEPLSHGFIRFAIALEAGLPLETVVKNKAGIYFDFNEPIITNEVFHTVGREFLLVGTQNVRLPELRVSTYPNPATDEWYLQLDGLRDIRDLEVTLLDARGRLIKTMPLRGNPGLVPVSDLVEGVYFYQLRRNEALLATGKLVRL